MASEEKVCLSLEDLAWLEEDDLDAVSKEGCATVGQIIREDPRFADQRAELAVRISIWEAAFGALLAAGLRSSATGGS